MKKPILIAAATAVLAAFQMNAAPAFPGKQTVTQPDGTTIEVRVVGDERFHTLVTDADALPIGRDADGEYRYRMADGSLSAVAAHNIGERTAAEADFLRANITDISVARLAERQRAINPKRFENAIAARKAKAPARAGAAKAPLADQFTDCPTTGVRRIPVIFVQYTDIKFKSSDPKQTFATYFNEGASSGRQYFIDNSNGVYQPQFDLYGPVTLPNNRKYYGGNDSYTDSDQRPGQMVADACTALDGQINFKDYDTNGDGYVDAVILLYAGNGEQYTYQNIPDAIWPHKWELSSSDYGKTLTLDGVKIDNASAVQEQIAKHRPNDKVKITVKRDGAVKLFDVTLRNKAGKTELITREAVDVTAALGGKFRDAGTKLCQELEIKGGVQVVGIKSNGILARARVKEGFVITHINDRPVYSLSDMERMSDKITSIDGIYPNGRAASYMLVE